MSENPEVSVVMLTYNQEEFVEDALLSVFAQEGPPVEIVICDDHSTDATFNIISEVSGRYSGPHKVRVFQHQSNLGFVGNFNFAVAAATGEYIVPAYGDDVSAPNRVKTIQNTFRSTQALLVYSDAIALDADGALTEKVFRKADFFKSTDPLDIAHSMALYLGASGAWHRSLFEKYGPLGDSLLFDDLILGFRAALEGKIVYIEAPLISYRSGDGISHKHLSKKTQSRKENCERREKILSQTIATLKQRLKDAQTFGLSENHPVRKKLSHVLQQSEMRLSFYELGWRIFLKYPKLPMVALKAYFAEGLRFIRNR